MKKIVLLSMIIFFMSGAANAVAEESLWDTNWNFMKLWRDGNSVTGEYIHDNGVLAGTLDGNILKGWWREYNNAIECGPDSNWSGPFVFHFSDDWKSFSGDWGYCDKRIEDLNPDSPSRPWTGTLREGITNYTETECLNASRYWCNGTCQIQPCGTDITQEQCEKAGKIWCNGICQIVQCNTLPIANAQSVSTDEETAKAVTLTGTDSDNDPLTYAVVTQPSHCTLSGTAPNLTYMPAKNYSGIDSFTFKVSDGKTDSLPATVNITVNPVNDAPTGSYQTSPAISVKLSGSDVENDAMTFTVLTQPAEGTLAGTAPNLIYIPNIGYTGTDSFTFKVNDGKSDSQTITVSLNVSGSGCGVVFDIGNDCKKGLEEAIDALQTVTGVK